MQTKRSISFAFSGALVLFVALQGCSDDGDANPTPPDDVTPTAGTKPTGGTGGKGNNPNTGGAADGGTSDGGTGNTGTGNTGNGGTGNTGTGNTGNNTAGAGVAGEGGGNNNPDPTCDPVLGADGCFNCPEDGEQEQWLNRCVDSDCVPFTKTLPPRKPNGSLQDLPN